MITNINIREKFRLTECSLSSQGPRSNVLSGGGGAKLDDFQKNFGGRGGGMLGNCYLISLK